MTTPFDASAHQSAHVLIDKLVELEVPLSRDVMYAFERLAGAAIGRRDAFNWFAARTEPVCSSCRARLAASRTVQVTDTETVERRLYECGAVEAEHTGTVVFSRELLAPCGDTERRVAAELARAAVDRALAADAKPGPEEDMCTRCTAGPGNESGRWWGGRASRQRADGAWVPDTSTFLWCVPVPFRVVEDPPVQPGRRPGAMTLGVLEALRAAQLSMSVPELLGRLGVHDRESKRVHNALLTLQRRGDVVRVVRGRYRAVPRG